MSSPQITAYWNDPAGCSPSQEWNFAKVRAGTEWGLEQVSGHRYQNKGLSFQKRKFGHVIFFQKNLSAWTIFCFPCFLNSYELLVRYYVRSDSFSFLNPDNYYNYYNIRNVYYLLFSKCGNTY